MDPRSDTRDFLVWRRARVTPEQARLPAYGANRRVKGARREEVPRAAGSGSSTSVASDGGTLPAFPT